MITALIIVIGGPLLTFLLWNYAQNRQQEKLRSIQGANDGMPPKKVSKKTEQKPRGCLHILLIFFFILTGTAFISLLIVSWGYVKNIIEMATKLPGFLTRWDVLLFIFISGSHIGSWIEEKIKEKPVRELDKRQDYDSKTFAATSLSSASTAGITAVAVLIPVSFVIVQIAKQPQAPTLSPIALGYVFRAALWFIGSLVCGLAVIYLIPLRGRTIDVAKELLTGVPFGLQLNALFVGVLCLLVALYHVVFK